MTWFWVNKNDLEAVDIQQIWKILPKLIPYGTTHWQNSYLKFDDEMEKALTILHIE